jgi:hypothetical protein
MSATRRKGVVALAFLASFLLVAICGEAAAQARRLEVVRLYGRVQWIAANQMVVTTDCMLLEACNPISVVIDLRNVSLSDYRGVRPGSQVLVEAVISHESSRHRVIATSIIQVEEWQAP